VTCAYYRQAGPGSPSTDIQFPFFCVLQDTGLWDQAIFQELMAHDDDIHLHAAPPFLQCVGLQDSQNNITGETITFVLLAIVLTSLFMVIRLHA
jgi:hypothetical protein